MDVSSKENDKVLLSLLNKKIANIPLGVLPALTLNDVIEQNPKAISLPNIPKDIQLAFLFSHRREINSRGGLAIKCSVEQRESITRAIFFYRLSPDSCHQFQRYHDEHRWNSAIFVALLTKPIASLSINRETGTHFPFPARRFVIAYLSAVLEHHNDPYTFTAREAFVKLWKSSAYDFFTFRPAQKKALKKVLKQLSKEWEDELDHARHNMGNARYVQEVGRFVGVLVPGRRDQRGRAFSYKQPDDVNSSSTDADILKPGALLEALKMPLADSEEPPTVSSDANLGSSTVTRVSPAISELKSAVPREMLMTLLKVFPLAREEADEASNF
ncbi:hypothetical protein P280DRAFT_554852 [Massarina eburnea CBS 473.64]|uniref:Uncharacterized protein n=1 Tax=Massarina eburnea CBS 473.64 TaxID=1395130 RepID=A0A6A6RF53_9PLEO|nr:hypothetical protein P280DRAFT_554852 [Massarina eburnea CBS 473.64]